MNDGLCPIAPGGNAVACRAMTRADIPAGLALCRASGWNQTAEDWEQLLVFGGDRCRVAVIDGRVVGTATTVLYEGRFAWIGMVLVAEEVRGRGIGRALLGEALGTLGEVPARLDATPKGYPLYLALGFVEECRLRRMTSRSTAVPRGAVPEALAVQPMLRADVDGVAAWDRSVFGATRQGLLEWARASAPELAFVVHRGGSFDGYCLGRRGYQFVQLGPVVAHDANAAAGLVQACRRQVPDAPLVIDVPATPASWTERLVDAGFVEQRWFVRMCRGANRHAGRPDLQWAILGPEWG